MACEEAVHEENITGNWRKRGWFEYSGRKLSNTSPAVMWKLENVSNKMDDLVKRFSARVLKVLLSFFLLFTAKCEKEEDKLKDELLNL